MTKFFLILPLMSFLIGCMANTVDVSPVQSYRPANSDVVWEISGSLYSEFDQITGAITRKLNIHINNEPVIDGMLSAMATGELSGLYKESKVHALCSSEVKTTSWMDVRCIILVDNERAATLTF